MLFGDVLLSTRSCFQLVMLLIVSLAGVMAPLTGHAATRPVILSEGPEMYSLGRHLDYIKEQGGRWSIDQVSSASFDARFKPSDTDTPNFGFTTDAYWYRLTLHSRLEEKHRFLLEMAYPAVDHLELYVENRDGSFGKTVVGDRYPHGNKVIGHHHFVFPLQLAPGQQMRIYFRSQTEGAQQMPLKLWTPQGMLDREHVWQLAIGIYLGFMIVMIFYNLFLFLSIRDTSYLYYVFFVCSALLYQTAFFGIAQEFLWPAAPWFANKIYAAAIAATNLFGLIFARRILSLPQHHPLLTRVIDVASVVTTGAMLLSFAVSYNYMIRVVAVLSIGCSSLALAAAIVSLRRRFKPARFYFAGWTALLLGIIFWAANKLGMLPVNPFTENGHLIGFVLNVVLLSFALADRFNLMREETERAQAEALRIQQQAARMLEEEVALKTEDLRNRTDELEQAYDRLSEHDRLKSRFFANVSHEVRTPLTLILTPLERLLGDASDGMSPSMRKTLSTMTGNVHRLLRLINQLLDFSRLESGGTAVSYERVDLRAQVEATVAAFEPFARSKGLMLEVRGKETLPEVWTDAGKLEKVLNNLLSNACKFTMSGGTVVVRLDHDDKEVAIAVKDTGIGIPEKELPHIFERFRQVDSSASRQFEGTGIGLALSNELMELVGGRLTAESDLGIGSTFTAHLPLEQEHIAREALIKADVQPGDGDTSSTLDAAFGLRSTVAALVSETGIRLSVDQTGQDAGGDRPAPGDGDGARPLVLVVEDNPDMRDLVADICSEDFRVLQAEDGEQGLALAQEHRPALVISDVMMPRMDGHELLRQIRASSRTATLPVILLTAKAGPEMRLDGLQSGADDYLTKPFESRELLARARNLVRLQHQEQQLRELNMSLQQRVIDQTVSLERALQLGRYLPPSLVRSVIEEGRPVEVEQRRCRLTVFRLELRGFGRLIQTLEPEEVTALLNGYLSEITEVVFSHEGTIDKLVRDTVMGFFGAPSSAGAQRDAVRAARAAVAMWQRATHVCSRWQELAEASTPLPTLVLVSGYATVGNFGSSSRMEYTAIGDPVDQAAQLLTHARDNEVICSHSTWSLIKEEIAGEPCDNTGSDSRSEPLRLYRLAGQPVDASPDAPAPRDTIRAPGPFAGPAAAPRSQAPAHDLQPGTIFAERYEVEQLLGRGGMGVVYRVRDQKLGVVLAMKLLHVHRITDLDYRKRLYREVKIARLISHPGVARIYDLADWEGDEFITMEFIEGQTLEQQLAVGGPLALDEGQEVLRQLCSAVGAAHAVGVVHRDLKPANVMIDPSGRVVVLDFGIARRTADVRLSDADTQKITGTPFYMSPEQFRGERASRHSDIYSLGVMAYEMFTGQRPFKAETIESLAYLHVNEPPPDPQQARPDLPARLAAVLMRCLEKTPHERFDTLWEMVNLLMGSPSAGTDHRP